MVESRMELRDLLIAERAGRAAGSGDSNLCQRIDLDSPRFLPYLK